MSELTRPTRPAWADAWERAHPSVTPPLVANVAAAPAQAVARSNCKAVDAKTGLACKLGAHSGDEHGHERGRFHLVAKPGQHVRRAVDEAAWGTQEVSL